MTIDTLNGAFAMTRAILAKVTPDQYGQPTTCASWDVRALANHVVEGANWFALCVEAGAAPDPDPTHGIDYAAGDLLGAYDDGARATLAAFGAPGAEERIITLPFGDLPGAAVMTLALNELFTHGWDLATSTGQSNDLDPALAAELLTHLEAVVGEDVRGPDGEAPFGPAVSAPPGATPAERLAAFLGRHVRAGVPH